MSEPHTLEYDAGAGQEIRTVRRFVPAFALGHTLSFIALSLFLSLFDPSQFRWPLLVLIVLNLILCTLAAIFGVSFAIYRKQRTNSVIFSSLYIVSLIGAILPILSITVMFLLNAIIAAVITAGIAYLMGKSLVTVTDTGTCRFHGLFRKYAFRSFVLLTLLFLAGIISAFVSLGVCESAEAKSMIRRMGKTSFHVADADTALIASKVYSGPILTGHEIPWIKVKPARLTSLFLCTLESGWVKEPQYGGGDATRYLCFFGLVIKLDTQTNWSS